MAENILSLKWSRHSVCFIEHLAKLRSKKLYSDVTIVCDGQYYHLHRFVLALCSKYFCEIFAAAHSQHPIIILNNIKCSTLEALLDFIYVGETQVLKEELPLLIKAAENLQVWGLSPIDTDESPHTPCDEPSNGIEPSTGHEPSTESALKLMDELEWKCYNSPANKSKCKNFSDCKIAKCKSQDDITGVHSHSRKRSRSFSSSSDKRQCLDLPPSENCSNDNLNTSCSSVFSSDTKGELLASESHLTSLTCEITDEDEHKDESGSRKSLSEVTSLDVEKPTCVKAEPQDSSSAILSHETSVCLDSSATDALHSFSASPGSVKHEKHFLDLYSSGVGEPATASSFATPFFDNATLSCGLLDAAKISEDHVEAAEEQETSVLRCSACSYETTSQSLLKLHSLSHADQMSFNNELSSLFARDPSFFPSDRSICSVDKPLTGSKFYSGERSFPCLFCNYVATQRSNLAKHIRIHTGEKPFACAHCPYRCTQKHHLSRHVARQHRLSMST